MKFTNGEAFESLKGVLTNNGKKPLRMSDRSLKEQSDALIELVANEDMELEEFVGKVSKLLSSTNSNVEKDASDRFKEHVKQWEEEHQKGSAQEDSAISKMMKRIEELENREAARVKENAIVGKKNELLKVMKEKGVKDEQWAKDLVNEISITEDFDIESKADSYLKLYNKTQAGEMGTGATPHGAVSNGNDPNKKDPLAGVRKLMQQRNEEREGLNKTKD